MQVEQTRVKTRVEWDEPKGPFLLARPDIPAVSHTVVATFVTASTSRSTKNPGTDVPALLVATMFSLDADARPPRSGGTQSAFIGIWTTVISDLLYISGREAGTLRPS